MGSAPLDMANLPPGWFAQMLKRRSNRLSGTQSVQPHQPQQQVAVSSSSTSSSLRGSTDRRSASGSRRSTLQPSQDSFKSAAAPSMPSVPESGQQPDKVGGNRRNTFKLRDARASGPAPSPPPAARSPSQASRTGARSSLSNRRSSGRAEGLGHTPANRRDSRESSKRESLPAVPSNRASISNDTDGGQGKRSSAEKDLSKSLKRVSWSRANAAEPRVGQSELFTLPPADRPSPSARRRSSKFDAVKPSLLQTQSPSPYPQPPRVGIVCFS